MALNLWAEDASRFGGLVLDAAYPIDSDAYAQGQIKPIEPPKGEAPKTVPIFVLVGDQDGGSRVWKQIEEPWRAAGIPLDVTYVAGGGHQWLLGPPQKAALLDWLGKLVSKG
jgi:hypothetical protein